MGISKAAGCAYAATVQKMNSAQTRKTKTKRVNTTYLTLFRSRALLKARPQSLFSGLLRFGGMRVTRDKPADQVADRASDKNIRCVMVLGCYAGQTDRCGKAIHAVFDEGLVGIFAGNDCRESPCLHGVTRWKRVAAIQKAAVTTHVGTGSVGNQLQGLHDDRRIDRRLESTFTGVDHPVVTLDFA